MSELLLEVAQRGARLAGELGIELRDALEVAAGAVGIEPTRSSRTGLEQGVGALAGSAHIEARELLEMSRICDLELCRARQGLARRRRIVLEREDLRQACVHIRIVGGVFEGDLEVAPCLARIAASELSLTRSEQHDRIRSRASDRLLGGSTDELPGTDVIADSREHSGSFGGRCAGAPCLGDDVLAQCHGGGRELALNLAPGAEKLAVGARSQRSAAAGQLVEQRGRSFGGVHAEQRDQTPEALRARRPHLLEWSPRAGDTHQGAGLGSVEAKLHLELPIRPAQARRDGSRQPAVGGQSHLAGRVATATHPGIRRQSDGRETRAQPERVAEREAFSGGIGLGSQHGDRGIGGPAWPEADAGPSRPRPIARREARAQRILLAGSRTRVISALIGPSSQRIER